MFSAVPMLASFVISFLNINSILQLTQFSTIRFTGLENFRSLLANPDVIPGFVKTFIFIAISVPASIIIPFFIALLLSREFHFKTVSRSMIFTPYVANIVGVSIAWSILLDPYDGIVNAILKALGISNPPMWFAGMNTVIPTVALISIWWGLAFPTILFIVAMQNVPVELHEAAIVDGAGYWKRVRHITIPLVSPTIFFLLITSIISGFQNYGIFRVLTNSSNGAPAGSGYVVSLVMYNESFALGRFSSGNAIAFILFICIMVLTIIQWRGQKKWVNY